MQTSDTRHGRVRWIARPGSPYTVRMPRPATALMAVPFGAWKPPTPRMGVAARTTRCTQSTTFDASAGEQVGRDASPNLTRRAGGTGSGGGEDGANAAHPACGLGPLLDTRLASCVGQHLAMADSSRPARPWSVPQPKGCPAPPCLCTRWGPWRCCRSLWAGRRCPPLGRQRRWRPARAAARRRPAVSQGRAGQGVTCSGGAGSYAAAARRRPAAGQGRELQVGLCRKFCCGQTLQTNQQTSGGRAGSSAARYRRRLYRCTAGSDEAGDSSGWAAPG